MATHAAIAAYADFSPAQRILAEAARVVAHPAVRNAGTIGGAIAHADPAADYPAALAAAGAVVHVAGAEGERTIPVDEFFVDYLETALEDGEMVTAVELPSGSSRRGCGVREGRPGRRGFRDPVAGPGRGA